MSALQRPVTHYAYVVEDIERAASMWSKAFGAGPFFHFGRVQFDALDYEEGAAVFDHEAALGQWGPIAVELQQIHDVQPASLRARLVPAAGTGVVHTSYVSDDPAADAQQLAGLGIERYLHASTGPFDLTFHEVPGTGHSVELYRRNADIEAFLAAMAASTRGWDGRDPLRHGAP